MENFALLLNGLCDPAVCRVYHAHFSLTLDRFLLPFTKFTHGSKFIL